MPKGSFYKPQFFDFMKEEFQACREGVGIIDMSSFSKIEVQVRKSVLSCRIEEICNKTLHLTAVKFPTISNSLFNFNVLTASKW